MTQIINNIEKLQERLNQLVISKDNHTELYELSTELDIWIVKYYKEK